MIKKIKVKHIRRKCVACGSCVSVAPQNWEMDSNDGKSRLRNSKETSKGEFYGEILELDLEDNKKAEGSCPMKCIEIR